MKFITILGIACTALLVLTGCSGGGGEGEPASTASRSLGPSSSQPDIITATHQGLQRGKASGQGQQLIFARAGLHQEAFAGQVFLAPGLVYYPRDAQPVLFDYPNTDIWSVRTDGTGDHAVLNSGSDEIVLDVNASHAVYDRGTYGGPNGREDEVSSLRHGGQHALLTTERFAQYRLLAGDRAVFNTQYLLFSVNLNGSDTRNHATLPNLGNTRLHADDAFGNTIIYREIPTDGTVTLKATPIAGGGETSLTDGQDYVTYAGHVGGRVVFHRCPVEAFTHRAGPCDVESIDENGSGRALLASQSYNEAVQGISGSHVIIRRNLPGNDQLVSVAVGGGAERLIMTMTDTDFVQLTADDFLVIRRPSGTWRLDLDGTLTQIGIVRIDSSFIIVGDSYCGDRGAVVWCMPLDGSNTAAVKIADAGKVLGAL